MADTIVTNDSDTIKETATMAYTPGYALPLPAESDNYNVEIVNEVTGKVDAALSMLKENKTNKDNGTISLAELASTKETCVVTVLANDLNVSAESPTGLWTVSVAASQYYKGLPSVAQIATLTYEAGAPYPRGTILTRVFYQDTDTWSQFTPIATATPPQEFALPLGNGFSAYTPCVYWENQFGEVKTNIRANFNSMERGQVLAMLPVGFRPIHPAAVTFKAHASDGSIVYGSADINVDGTVTLFPDVPIQQRGEAAINPFVFNKY